MKLRCPDLATEKIVVCISFRFRPSASRRFFDHFLAVRSISVATGFEMSPSRFLECKHKFNSIAPSDHFLQSAGLKKRDWLAHIHKDQMVSFTETVQIDGTIAASFDSCPYIGISLGDPQWKSFDVLTSRHSPSSVHRPFLSRLNTSVFRPSQD
jgi:hypothetical protein